MTAHEEFHMVFTALEDEWGRDINNNTPKDRRLYAQISVGIVLLFFITVIISEREFSVGPFIGATVMAAFVGFVCLRMPSSKSRRDSDALREVSNQMIRALARLHHVAPYDLTDYEKHCLLKMLDVSTHKAQPLYDARLALAVIATLAKVGNSQYLPILERLAHRINTTPAGQRITSEAKKCITAIEKRREHETEGKTLLRPSDDSALSTTLLRPARDSADGNQNLLLHPAVNSKEPDSE